MNEEMALSQHVNELRQVVLKICLTWFTAFFLSFVYYQALIGLLTASITQGSSSPVFVMLSPLEGILTVFKMAFWFSLVASSPLWLIFITRFVFPALRKEEKRWAWPMLALSVLFLFLGFFIALKCTIPWANRAFAVFNAEIGINAWSLGQYVDYALLMILGHGALFECAILLFFFVHFGIFTKTSLQERRKYFILGAFILAALLTPPDIFTQCLLAVPCCLFYEGAILYARFREQKQEQWVTAD